MEEWRVLGPRKYSTLMLQKSDHLTFLTRDGYPCDGQIYLSPNPSAAHVSGWLAAAGLLCPAQLLRRGDRIEVTGPDSGERPGTEPRSSWTVRRREARGGLMLLRLCCVLVCVVCCAVRAERKLLRSDWLQLPD